MQRFALPVLTVCLAMGCGNDTASDSGSGGTSAGGTSAGGTSSAGTSAGGTSAGGTNAGGTSSGGTSAGGTGPGPTCNEAEHSGEGTYYAADGSGNCSFDPSPNNLMVAAMNQTDYQTSAACGRCAAIDGPDGSVTVRIVDRCPECAPGDIDMSPQAFEKIAPIADGRVPIKWKYVGCDAPAAVGYHFKEGSNQWWTAVQVRGHRYGIAKFEYDSGGGNFVEVARENYNYFVEPSGMGTGPYTFRITDVYGGQVTDTGIAFAEAQTVSGAAQLPACQ